MLLRSYSVFKSEHDLSGNGFVLCHFHGLCQVIKLVIVRYERLEIISVLDLGHEADGSGEPVCRAAGTGHLQGLPDGLADLNGNLAADGVADETDAAAVAGNVKDGCDTDIVAGALDDDGCAAAVCELKDLLLNRPDCRIYSVGCAIHHSILPSGFNRIHDDDICTGSCADHSGGAADGACTDDDTVIGSVGITAVAPDTPVCDIEVLDEDTDLIRPVFGNLVCVSFLEDHVLAESTRRVRSETDFSEVQACRRHLAVFAVCALMAGKDAVADDLVAFLDGGDAGADLNSSADPLVTGGVGSDVITAFSRLAFEALDIRLDRKSVV